jgi:hypothetical protein
MPLMARQRSRNQQIAAQAALFKQFDAAMRALK